MKKRTDLKTIKVSWVKKKVVDKTRVGIMYCFNSCMAAGMKATEGLENDK